MQVYPNAKINLGLNVVEKRPDGYHNLETIFYPLKGLKDILTLNSNSGGQDSFELEGIKIDGDADNNLVVKALKLLRKDFEIPACELKLQKDIPFGAGLGGGSADAAFTLKALNEKYDLRLSNKELEQYASSLGADCPVFIENKPVYAEGIGNIFTPIALDLSAYFIVLVKPNIHVSTPEAYSMVKPAKPEMSLLEIIKRPVEEWKGLMKNDFEPSVFSRHPYISEIKQKLYDLGALYASMSGSGSSVFGIFKHTTQLSTHFPGSFVFEGKL